MRLTEFVQVVAGLLGTMGFAILFNIRGKKYIAASLGGFLSWTIFLLLEPIVSSEAIRYFWVAVTISVYAELMARTLKTPTTTGLMISLIPLVPGKSLYYTMASAFEYGWEEVVFNAKNTLYLAVALALGIVITNIFIRTLSKIGNKKTY